MSSLLFSFWPPICAGRSTMATACLFVTTHLWTSAATTRFVMGSMYIHKTCDSCCNHRLVFSCDPNFTRFPLLIACLRDPLINGVFFATTLLQLTPFPTGQIFPFFIDKESIWIANVHTINDFVIFISSPTTPATTTAIYSNTASAASYSVHHVDTDPTAAIANLGEMPNASMYT